MLKLLDGLGRVWIRVIPGFGKKRGEKGVSGGGFGKEGGGWKGGEGKPRVF